MTKLNQIIAIEKGVKGRAAQDLTNAYHEIQKTPLLSGISRTYQPKDDDGDQLPPESTQVQIRADDVVKGVTDSLTRMYDVILTKETANCTAVADVVVDGVTILSRVPVTYLLFLEKQLVDMHTFVKKLPVLDAADAWARNDAANAYATNPVQTTRTKKVPKNWVKAEATDKHPAQVEVYHEDVLVGYWTTVKFSGALPASRVAELLTRVEGLQQAVKTAREDANSVDIVDRSAGKDVFDFLFG